MIKQEITYEGFDGEEITETHYFHLSKKKLFEMEDSLPGGYQAKLERVGKSADGGEIMRTFSEFMSHAYGLRVEGQGGAFKQSSEISETFLNSLAFDAFLMKLLTDPPFAVQFINGLMPKDLMDFAARQAVEARTTTVHLDGSPQGLPDPNGLDTNGPWPRSDQPAQSPENTGLEHPYDTDHQLVPWAFREPTKKELTAMSSSQMTDVYRRAVSGWKPPPPVLVRDVGALVRGHPGHPSVLFSEGDHERANDRR